MQIKVMDRVSARKYSFNPNIFKTAMISIYSHNWTPNTIKINENGVAKVLFLKFDDTETENYGMTKKDAKNVAKFIKEIGEEHDILIVHCDAGISRSSGVAAAIMKYLYNDDTPIFNNPLYQPNMRCYRLVLNALYDDNN